MITKQYDGLYYEVHSPSLLVLTDNSGNPPLVHIEMVRPRYVRLCIGLRHFKIFEAMSQATAFVWEHIKEGRNIEMLKKMSTLALLISVIYLSCAPQSQAATVCGSNCSSAASNVFQELFDDFKQLGYPVGTIGCQSGGHMRNSKHHWGGACDIWGQTARNVTPQHHPSPAVQIEIARKHGLISGCEWHRSPDCGHFEMPGRGSYRIVRSRHKSKRYVAKSRHRAIHVGRSERSFQDTN